MFRYLVSRVIQSMILLFLVSLITFIMVNKAPGLPAIVSDLDISEEEQDRMIRNLGLDLPLHVQYLDWATGVLQGDIGRSYLSGRPVIDLVKSALPASMLLASTSLIIAIVVAIPVGVYSALHRYSILDYVVTMFSFFGASIPGFWYALLLILIFGVSFGWLPTSGMSPIGEEATFTSVIPHLILPSAVLSTAAMAQLTRYTRSSMVEVLRKEYIRTAHAKGLRANLVVMRHALINALFPVITVVALLLPTLIGGAAIVELVFAWPGIGRLAIDAALTRDYPTVMGVTLLISTITIASNLLIDVIYVFLDPRLANGRPVIMAISKPTLSMNKRSEQDQEFSMLRLYWRRFKRNKLAVLASVYLLVIYLLALLTPLIAPYEPDAISLGEKFITFSPDHLLGTDQLGRDILTRLLYGARISLAVGFVSIVIAMFVGTLIGVVAGYQGKWVDVILMRFTDGMLSIPLFFLLLTALTVFDRSAFIIMFFIGLSRWMTPARVVRSEVLKNKTEEYVLAARALGAGPIRIMFKHLLPQAIPSMLVAASFGIAQAILIESALSYIGLGIQPPMPSWGNMLLDAQSFVYIAPLLAIYPGIFIFITVLAYNAVGDGLRDALDPYSVGTNAGQ